ncbi:MAG: hypothetical protein ACJAV1_000435 [Paraglaciecola sp.]|jgi:hypothetical protein
MNGTAIAIVALVCWAIVELVNGAKGKKKDTAQVNNTNELEREVEVLRGRIETLEKIVTDEKYDLNRQFYDLKNNK